MFPAYQRPYRVAALCAIALGGLASASCSRDPFVVNRSVCPAVAVPQYAGEMTLFSPEASRDASALDVAAVLTNVRGVCADDGPIVETAVRFDVVATRRDATAARSVTLPIFVAVARAGETVVAKQATAVRLDFAAGSARATGSGGAQVGVNRQEVLLPRDINDRITRERKPGDLDAATDPLSEPSVRDAVRDATFEVLVGFQLSADQLAYNALK